MREPRGAAELIRCRLSGKAPAVPVVVTDLAIIAKANKAHGVFVLMAGPGEWDMRCLRGLSVIVWCWTEDLLGIVESIALASPAEIGVMTREKIMQFPKLMEAA
jgi:hypothetical protein